MAISSLIYKIMGSKNLPTPLEIPLFLEKDLAKPENKKNIINATKIIDGVNSGNGGNAQGPHTSQIPVHFIATLPSDYHIVDINQIEIYSSRTGNSMWRNAGLQVLLLDASLNIKVSTSVTSTAESLYTFNINNPTFNITGGSSSYKNDPSIFQNIVVYGNNGGASQGNALNGTAAGGGGGFAFNSVSYTHLTLPTILLV